MPCWLNKSGGWATTLPGVGRRHAGEAVDVAALAAPGSKKAAMAATTMALKRDGVILFRRFLNM